MILWFRIAKCLENEADVRLYESCIKHIHRLAFDDDEKMFLDWWNTFWSVVSMKTLDAAANYVEEFLDDLIDRQQFGMVSLLSVRVSLNF